MRPRVSGICGSDLLDWYVRRKAGSILGHEVAGELVAVGRRGDGVLRPGTASFRTTTRRVSRAPTAPRAATCTARSGAPRGWIPAAWPSSCGFPAGQPRARHAAHPRRGHGRGGELHRAARDGRQGVSGAGASRSGQSILVRRPGPGRTARAATGPRARGGDARSARIGVASRLAAARASGADAAIDVDREGRSRRVRGRLTGGHGFDFVFVGPGKAEVIREAAEAVAPGGTLLLFTMAPPGESWPASLYDLYFREIAVVPSYSCGPDDTREALALIASRRVAVADLVSHRFALRRARRRRSRAPGKPRAR